MLKNNPDFKEVFTHEHYRFYIPAEHTKYHTSRYLEANNQLIFAGAGATKDVITAHMEKIVEFCNLDRPPASFRTDVAAIANALIYRTKKPVDEKCSIRMGALLCFMEYDVTEDITISDLNTPKTIIRETVTEDPDTVKPFWLEKKMELAANSPDLYTFFLTWGISNIPQYREALDTLKSEDYFQERREMIRSLLVNLPQLASL